MPHHVQSQKIYSHLICKIYLLLRTLPRVPIEHHCSGHTAEQSNPVLGYSYNPSLDGFWQVLHGSQRDLAGQSLQVSLHGLECLVRIRCLRLTSAVLVAR